MKLLRALWLAFRALARVGGTIALWTIWLALAVVLAVQIRIATAKELTLPQFVRSALQRQLADAGLTVSFSSARFDPFGHALLADVRLGVSTQPDPLATAHAVYLRLDPWPLLVGHARIRELRVTGATLQVPAMTSPTGRAEAVVDDLDFTLLPDGRNLMVPHLTAHIGALDLVASGALRLPRPSATAAPELSALVSLYVRQAGEIYSRTRADRAPLSEPRLEIQLTPSEDHIAVASLVLTASAVSLPANEFQSGPLRLTTTVPLSPTGVTALVLAGQVTRPAYREDFSADQPVFVLHADLQREPLALTPRRLEIAVGSVTSRLGPLTTGPVAATLTFTAGQPAAVTASVTLADSPWSLATRLDNPAGYRLDFSGPLNAPLLSLVNSFLPRRADQPATDLNTFVQFADPARLDATVTLNTSGQLTRASGHLSVGRALAAEVALDAAATNFLFVPADNLLLCSEAYLRAGASEAHGSYTMDTATLDYRFLLAGHLRPADINGWFTDWWPDLWKKFQFPAHPPEADVDIRGRWGAPTLSALFITTEAPGAIVRGVAFDLARARLFLRYCWNDVLEFYGTQGTQTAHGSFAITEDPASDHWLRLEFNGVSDLDLDTAAKIFGAGGTDFVAPYRFAAPPHLKLHGWLAGETDTDWTHQHVDVAIESSGDFSYSGFPVRNLVAQVLVRDDQVELPALAFNFAEGRTVGQAKLWTATDGVRRLAFDAKLTRANLGETIRTVQTYQAQERHEPTPPASALQQRLATGNFDLTLAAEGRYDDFLSFHGSGTATLSGADLGEIQMFGLLSELLSHTLLDFSSLSLDTARADFTLAGDRVNFPTYESLALTGPRAAIAGKGSYRLDNDTLDFAVKVFPFKENRNLVTSIVSLLTDRLSSALEVKLQGTLDKPNWTFVYGPANLLRSLTNEIGKVLPLPSLRSTSPAEPAPLPPSAPPPAAQP